MSTATHANGPDSMVTVKVTYDGTTRRVKMPLREMVPRVLEEHIRTFLHIPVDQKAMVERYSDSAAAFVLLDSTNMAVYKQLYRAAKAKSKLKLRVTLIEQEPKTVPKPVSVQDVPETAAEPPKPQASAAASQTSLPLRTASSISREYDPFLLNKAAQYVAESEHVRRDFESRLSCLVGRTGSYVNSIPRSVQPQPKSNAITAMFAVSCNSCARTASGAHYHCSTCEDGDFDLCQSCIDQGITCHSDDHWLIKRTVVDGNIIKSSTEKISPKPKPKPKVAKPEPQLPSIRYPACVPPFGVSPLAPSVPVTYASQTFASPALETWGNMRTCNICLSELPEAEFLHCDKCEDFDLCQPCFSKDAHGHHPMHAFAPAVAGTSMPEHIKIKMAPGRNKVHLAICDGCDKNITGVRHKCLDCPDWDYCAECVVNAAFIHPEHRFAPLYEPLSEAANVCTGTQPVHMGICCDGPVCKSSGSWPSYIRGTRYKCAVCHDLDFCANCEANPANEHNKTHPLIKFKTPVRHVSVTTTGEHHDGKQMQLMGDRFMSEERPVSSNNSVNAVKTVVDVQPEEPEVKKKSAEPVEMFKQVEVKVEKPIKVDDEAEMPAVADTAAFNESDLRAGFVRDSVADGTILALNHVFEQTWSLRNEGSVPWPAGCAVKFVGGDYMGHVDSAHPAGISELVSASESTVCYSQLAPGQEFQFTVLLRTPARAGKFISYWRLTTPDGYRFGDRLWCEVNARAVQPESPKAEQPKEEGDSQASSIMIFPKLEKESPVSSMHQDVPAAPASSHLEDVSVASEALGEQPEDEDWDASEDGFMTDEEYDILDASDEEYLEEQHRKMLSK